MESNTDHGLAVLEEVYVERTETGTDKPVVSIDLLRDCYRISHRHRYDNAQDSTLRKELQQAVESFVDAPLKSEEP